jgi:predicted kinase
MEAVIFIGVQGAGKSTYYREKFFDTHVRISLDLLRTRQRERTFLQACVATGQKFVVDNTNILKIDRAVYIEAAKAAGFHVTGYFFDVELREALRRNNARGGIARIPVPGVIGTWKRMERPELSESFDDLVVVKHE